MEEKALDFLAFSSNWKEHCVVEIGNQASISRMFNNLHFLAFVTVFLRACKTLTLPEFDFIKPHLCWFVCYYF